MEASFKSRVEEYQKRLVELSSAMEGLQRKSDALLEGFQGQLQNALKGLEQNVSKGVADEAKKQLASMTQASFEPFTKAATEEFRSHLRKTLDESLAKSVRAFEAEHAESMRQHREAIQNQFDNLTKSRLEEHRWGNVAVQHTPKPRATGLRAGLTAGLGLAAVALILVPISLSRHPVVRLRVEPPAGFVDERPDWNAKRRAREEQLARAYWERAVQDLQTKYAFGTNLPEEPPAEFKVEEKGLPGKNVKVDPGARARYWEKIRQVWARPEMWDKSSDWNTEWTRGGLGSADGWLQSLRKILRKLYASS
jgi:hypothetical protein